MLIFANDYTGVWLLYLLGAAGCLAVLYRITRWLWWFVREPLWLLATVVLLTPTLIDPERSLYAPAIAVTALDMLFDLGSNAWRAVSDLVLYGLIGLLLYLVFVGVRWFLGRDAEPEQAPPTEQQEDDRRKLRERMVGISQDDRRAAPR